MTVGGLDMCGRGTVVWHWAEQFWEHTPLLEVVQWVTWSTWGTRVSESPFYHRKVRVEIPMVCPCSPMKDIPAYATYELKYRWRLTMRWLKAPLCDKIPYLLVPGRTREWGNGVTGAQTFRGDCRAQFWDEWPLDDMVSLGRGSQGSRSGGRKGWWVEEEDWRPGAGGPGAVFQHRPQEKGTQRRSLQWCMRWVDYPMHWEGGGWGGERERGKEQTLFTKMKEKDIKKIRLPKVPNTFG